jgi:hypothetical protein
MLFGVKITTFGENYNQRVFWGIQNPFVRYEIPGERWKGLVPHKPVKSKKKIRIGFFKWEEL